MPRRMLSWPSKTNLQHLCLWGLWSAACGEKMSERQISALLKGWHLFGDAAILRRTMVEELGLVSRDAGVSVYLRQEVDPARRCPRPDPRPASTGGSLRLAGWAILPILRVSRAGTLYLKKSDISIQALLTIVAYSAVSACNTAIASGNPIRHRRSDGRLPPSGFSRNRDRQAHHPHRMGKARFQVAQNRQVRHFCLGVEFGDLRHIIAPGCDGHDGDIGHGGLQPIQRGHFPAAGRTRWPRSSSPPICPYIRPSNVARRLRPAIPPLELPPAFPAPPVFLMSPFSSPSNAPAFAPQAKAV